MFYYSVYYATAYYRDSLTVQADNVDEARTKFYTIIPKEKLVGTPKFYIWRKPCLKF